MMQLPVETECFSARQPKTFAVHVSYDDAKDCTDCTKIFKTGILHTYTTSPFVNGYCHLKTGGHKFFLSLLVFLCSSTIPFKFIVKISHSS